jgi:hypothetical protein
MAPIRRPCLELSLLAAQASSSTSGMVVPASAILSISIILYVSRAECVDCVDKGNRRQGETVVSGGCDVYYMFYVQVILLQRYRSDNFF